MRVSTYNVRVDTPVDWKRGKAWWFNRRKKVLDNIELWTPDILGVQEIKHWLQFLSMIPRMWMMGYDWVSFGRGTTNGWFGERLAVFWDKKMYKMIRHEVKFFSETPNKSSYGWDAKYKKFFLKVYLEDLRTKEVVIVYNNHFDSVGLKARIESAKMLAEDIKATKKQFKGSPIIALGDFNTNESMEGYGIITEAIKDSYYLADILAQSAKNTYTRFMPAYDENERVDLIFTNKKAIHYANWYDNIASDHNMVTVKIK